MRPVVVVPTVPVFGHAAHFIERGEDVAIDHFGAERAVEAFGLAGA